MNLPKGSTKNDKLKLAELESIRELLSKYDVQGKLDIFFRTFFLCLTLSLRERKKRSRSSFFFLVSKKKESLKQYQKKYLPKTSSY